MATLPRLQPLPTAPAQYLPEVDPAAVEQAMMVGDLSQMSPEVRIAYYVATCRSLGLNPLTKPFQALKTESGEVHLYPDKGCAEQLRKRDSISLRILSREYVEDLYIVTVEATTPDGRTEQSEGVVSMFETLGEWKEGTRRNGQTYRYKQDILGPDGEPIVKRLTGDASGRARMRAETKAKRRVTLAICGLGMPDVEGGRPVTFDPQQGTLQEGDGLVDMQTGEVLPAPRLLDAPAEQAKTMQDHIGDLFGDGIPAPTPLHPTWSQIARWYAEAGCGEKYGELEAYACRLYGVRHVRDINEMSVREMADKVYAKLEPLIVARQAAQDVTNFAREGTAKARDGEIDDNIPAAPTEAARRQECDTEVGGSQGPSWGPDSPNLFEAEEAAEKEQA